MHQGSLDIVAAVNTAGYYKKQATSSLYAFAGPSVRITVIGSGKVSTPIRRLNQKRINAIINYLVNTNGVSESRLKETYNTTGKKDTIAFKKWE